MENFWTRFHSKYSVHLATKCWLWFGATGRGYGVIQYAGKLRIAHLVAYELMIGKVPDGFELDHLCRNRNCVNPEHLEPVTHSENCRRGSHAEANRDRARIIMHCPQGHPYAGDNLYVKPNGRRECRECVRASGRRYAVRIGKSSGTKVRQSSLGKLPRQSMILNRQSWLAKEGD